MRDGGELNGEEATAEGEHGHRRQRLLFMLLLLAASADDIAELAVVPPFACERAAGPDGPRCFARELRGRVLRGGEARLAQRPRGVEDARHVGEVAALEELLQVARGAGLPAELVARGFIPEGVLPLVFEGALAEEVLHLVVVCPL